MSKESKASKRRRARARAAARRAAENVEASVPVQPRKSPVLFQPWFVFGCLLILALIILDPELVLVEISNADAPASMPQWRQAGAPVPWHAGVASSAIISKLAKVADLINNTACSQLHWLVNKLENGRFALSDLILLHPDGVLRDGNISMLFPASYSIPLDLNKLQALTYLDSRSIKVELDRAIRGINLLWKSFVEEEKLREEIIRERIKAAAKFGLTLEAIQPFRDGNERVTRKIITLMLVRALGFQIQLPESRFMESRGRFIFVYMIHHSLQLQQFPPRHLPRLNSSDYAAFLLDCAYDRIHGVDVDSPW